MEVPHHEFIDVVPKTTVMEAIRIVGFSFMKLVYETLKEKGCKTFPKEGNNVGKIWVYDPDTQECIEYTQDEFNNTFVRK